MDDPPPSTSSSSPSAASDVYKRQVDSQRFSGSPPSPCGRAQVYERLMNQTDVADASEAVHMVERLAQVAFGAATLRGGVVLVRNETKFSRG